ncbi:MAG: hypothetical protein ABIT09_01210 [Croceibacterium sp.]
MDGPIIAVRAASGGMFTVGIEPPDGEHPLQSYPDKRSAWGAAGGLKMVLGIAKVDFTGVAE